jgi:hypothetical protein
VVQHDERDREGAQGVEAVDAGHASRIDAVHIGILLRKPQMMPRTGPARYNARILFSWNTTHDPRQPAAF